MLIFDQLKRSDPQLRTLTIGALVGMGILLAGLWFVQVISYRYYAENQKSQSFRTVRIPAIRGKILDRNGIALAENQPSYNVALYLDELREQFQAEYARIRPRHVVTNSVPFWKRWMGVNPVQTNLVKLTAAQRQAVSWHARYRVVSNITQRLAVALGQPVPIDYGTFLNHYTNQLALPLPLLVNLTEAQIARLQEQASNPPGLDLEVQPMRFYPFGTTAAHLVGVLKRDNSSAKDEDAFFNFRLPDYRGDLGIEWGFDEELRGKAGVKSVLVNSLGYRQSEQIWTPAEPGKNVVLTIDYNIQKQAEVALENAMSNRIVRGAVVVMDPNSGDILALASAPSFDPNAYIPKLSPEAARRIYDPIFKPQMNRATQQNYAPGSIFKVLTGAMALEHGLDPNRTYTVQPNPLRPSKGIIYVGRRAIDDTAPPGEYNFRRAFIRSSNSYFITNGINKGGIEPLVELGHRLFLGQRAGLPTRQETAGHFPSTRRIRAGWFDGDTANLCIGQGEISTTPLQMAVMIAAIANGGKVLYPRLVDRIEPQDGGLPEEAVPFPRGRVRGQLGLSARTLQIIRDAMLADVEDKEGTGQRASVPGLRICAKTGTAQVTDASNRVVDHTTWFASYAPYDKPRYVVLVMVESGASGGETCAPVAREIYRTIQYEEAHRSPALATN